MSIADSDFNVCIRTGHLSDTEAILGIHRGVVTENKYLISTPDEFDKTLEKQRMWIQKILENEREIVIIAEKDEKVIGWLAFESSNRKRLSHTGSFEMMIHKDYRGS